MSGISLLTGVDMNCIFSHGDSKDVLTVKFSGTLSAEIAANTITSFKVRGVRGSTSTQTVSGLAIATASGSREYIDRTTAAISLVTTAAAKGTQANMEVKSDDPSINAVSALTLRVQTINPLQPNSGLTITIPRDFGIDGITEVSTLGSALETNPVWTFDKTTRVLTIKKINKIYLATREFLYVKVNKVKNPGQTNPTASFTYKIFDPSD